MPPQAKKRKAATDDASTSSLDASSASSSTSVPQGAPSCCSRIRPLNPQRFRRLVAVVDSADIKRRVLAGALTASADELATVLRFLGLAERSEVQPAHCVRCHARFDETLNHEAACKIVHPAAAYDEHECYKSGKQYEFSLPCCGLGWQDHTTDPEPPEDYCVLSRHTTSLEDVREHHRTDAEVEERGDYDARGRIFRTCAQAGCK